MGNSNAVDQSPETMNILRLSFDLLRRAMHRRTSRGVARLRRKRRCQAGERSRRRPAMAAAALDRLCGNRADGASLEQALVSRTKIPASA